jgi:hypothetical protein
MALHDPLHTDLQIGMIADPLAWPKWPEAKAFLDPALMASDEDWPAVEQQLSSDHAQLWAINGEGGDLRGCAVTRWHTARSGDVVEVFLVGGEGYRDWIGPLDRIIALAAKTGGAVGLRAYGRIGWVKPLAAQGWRVGCVCYERAL